MTTTAETSRAAEQLKAFLNKKQRRAPADAPTAVSLFSGAGISDIGYELAGFRFCVQVEMEPSRAAIGARNFPESEWIVKDAREANDDIVASYRRKTKKRLSLLVATPPCQGMSSSNPSRGKRKTKKAKLNDDKNTLILSIVPVVQELRPRVIATENIRQILTHTVNRNGKERRVIGLLAEALPDYTFFETVVNVADYGIPQTRYRALVVGVHSDEKWLRAIEKQEKAPWPKATRASAPVAGRPSCLTAREWFGTMQYAPLSSKSHEEAHNGHPLHFVPHYEADRHLLVSDIPPHSGRSAYENDTCPHCGAHDVPLKRASCVVCDQPMTNRPIVIEEAGPRLIKGFASSYRRMSSDAPAPTVTTNSSHVGSDNKIHPWEDRVLSILECADLQTVPRCFDWSVAVEGKKTYLIRNVVGEAFPSYFTYCHGQAIRRLLTGTKNAFAGLASWPV